jgi:hypothetical protein
LAIVCMLRMMQREGSHEETLRRLVLLLLELLKQQRDDIDMPELLLRGVGACMLDLCTIHNRILGDVALGADSFAIGEAHLAAVSPPGDWVLIGHGPGAAVSLGLVRKRLCRKFGMT